MSIEWIGDNDDANGASKQASAVAMALAAYQRRFGWKALYAIIVGLKMRMEEDAKNGRIGE